MPLNSLPVYGREGFLLPLGPIVQHTGQLDTESRIDEVWAFGMPQQGIELPGLLLQVENSEGEAIVSGLRAETRVRAFGEVLAKRRDDQVAFRQGPESEVWS